MFEHVVVIGSSGFIGSHVVDELVSGGIDVQALDILPSRWDQKTVFESLDVRDGVETLRAIQRIGPDCVINLAGVLGTSETYEDVAGAYSANAIGAVNVLEACRSVSARYIGVQTGTPWLNPYAASKRAAVDIARIYHSSYGFPASILRVFNAFGSRQSGTGHFRKLVPTFTKLSLENAALPAYGDGLQPTDLVPVELVAKAFTWSVSMAPGQGEIIDIGTGVPTSVLDVGHRVIELTTSGSSFDCLGPRFGEGGEYPIADVTLLSSLLDLDSPTEPLSLLDSTVDWYVQHRQFLDAPEAS